MQERCRLKEVEELSRSISMEIGSEVDDLEVCQISPRKIRDDSVQAQLAQRREVSVEECVIEDRFDPTGNVNIELLKKGRMATEMFEDTCMPPRIDSQGFESMDMRDYQGKRVVDYVIVPEVEFQRR